MDRSMKVMFGMMTVAICLMALSMTGNQSQQAYAGEYVGGADRGTEPTIVWYGTVKNVLSDFNNQHKWELVRAWSDGVVESRSFTTDQNGCDSNPCNPAGWRVISDPNEGLAARSDLNDDENVNINDLLTMLDDWGPAPANVIPPSDCPLAMILP